MNFASVGFWLIAGLPVSQAGPVDVGADIRSAIAGGRFSEARAQCLAATSRDPSDVEHWICVARMSAWLANFAAATSAYDAALSLDPENVEAITGKALVLIWQRRFDGALALLKRAQTLTSSNAEVELAFAQLERARGRTREARLHALSAAAMDGANTDVRTLLESLGKSSPVVVQFGATRDSYSFTTPSVLSSLEIDYRGENGTTSLFFEAGDRFGQRIARGGAGYSKRLNGRWTAHVQALVGPGGDVYPAFDVKVGMAARLGAHWVAAVDYRGLAFANSSVQIASPSVEYYWKKWPIWAQAVWNESWSAYKQQPGAGRAGGFGAQMNGQLNRRTLLKIGVASGAENFINLGQIGGIREKSLYGGIDYRLSGRYTAGLSYGFAERSNNLTQGTWGIKLVARL